MSYVRSAAVRVVFAASEKIVLFAIAVPVRSTLLVVPAHVVAASSTRNASTSLLDRLLPEDEMMEKRDIFAGKVYGPPRRRVFDPKQMKSVIPEGIDKVPERVFDPWQLKRVIPEGKDKVPERVFDPEHWKFVIPEGIDKVPERVFDPKQMKSVIPEGIDKVPERVFDPWQLKFVIPKGKDKAPERVFDPSQLKNAIPEGIDKVPLKVFDPLHWKNVIPDGITSVPPIFAPSVSIVNRVITLSSAADILTVLLPAEP
jgi:hypothetical protein